MNSNICNHCGGEYMRREGRWRCPYCGSYKPEEISNEEVTLLYTAFQKLRLAEFQEAEQAFDDMIQRYPGNHHAYWGRLMAKHGAKYEEDFDGRRIPTCYATSIDSVMNDDDYQKALQYADEENRCYYQEQAEYMERVRKEWLEKAQKEKPYDIFICYKDSDAEKGIERTNDSIVAQDIYTHLTDLGYHVFYSHVSLQGKVGEKYEPYIFNALSTAKVMLVYGSSPEYINSTWLKNEWTRYEKRIQSGEKKQGSLLVACDGFSPNELPHALSSMQCFDANDRSFYGNLDKTVEKLVRGDGDEPDLAAGNLPSVKKKKKAPLFISLFLLLAAIGGFLAWGFLSGGFMTTVSNSLQNATVVSHSGTFPKGTEFYMEEISPDESLTEKVATLAVNKQNYHLYDMELRHEGSVLNVNGNITVTLPLPSGIPAEKAVVYYMSGNVPQKISSQVADGKISFVTNHFSLYMVAEEIEVCNHVPVTDYAVAATCTKDGLTEGRHCSLCGEILAAQTVIPASHTPGPAADCTNGQHCTVCRAELQKALGHTPGKEATCTTEQTCTVCRAELTPAKGHKPGAAATCTTAQTCKTCHAELAAAKGHTPGAAATCTTAQTCTVCRTELVAAKGHKPGAVATCTTAQTCTECHAELAAAKGHTPGAEATCTTAQICTVCNAELEGAKGHTPDAGATCEKPSKCLVCNEILDASALHTPGAAATCTTAQTCTVCHTELAPAKGHMPGAEATCTEAQTCTDCNAELTPAKGHTPGAEATCTAAQTCTVCGEAVSPAKGHKAPENAICTEPSNCTVCGEALAANGSHKPGSAATCTTAQICTLCHTELTPAKGHKPGAAATCTTAQTCTSCGATVKEALGHTEVIDPAVPATPESNGLTEGKHCSVCNTVLVKQEIVYANSSQGLAYEVNDDGTTCTITGIGSSTDTVIRIADMYNGYKVTAIGDRAFADQTQITEIHLPETVKQIGTRAFYGCTGLTEIVIPASVTSIGTQIFYNCTNLATLYYRSDYASSSNPFVFQSSLKKVVFEGTLVGDSFLSGCAGVTEVVIKDSVTKVGNHAFKDCTGLTSVTIGTGVTSVGSSAFSGCTGFVNVVIPDNVQTLGSYVFSGCTALESVKLGQSLTSLGSSAFSGCVALKTVEIPNGIKTLNSSVFSGCTGLSTIVIPNSVTTMSEKVFSGCTGLSTIVIPNTVTSMGNNVFEDCTALSNVTISNGLTKIPSYTFRNCISLASVTIPDSVTNIEGNAFYGCKGLTGIVIPDSVTAIGSSAFGNCSMLMSVTIPNSLMSIGSNAFQYCYRLIEVVNHSALTITPGETSNGWVAYYAKEVHNGASQLVEADGFWFCLCDSKYYLVSYTGTETVLTLPEKYNGGSYGINACAFYNCNQLTSVTVPKSVTTIGESAFHGCSGLTNMTLPFVGGSAEASEASASTLFGYIFGNQSYSGGANINQSYGASAKTYCIPTGLKTVTVTGGKLFYGAFYDCTMLTDVTIGDDITAIGASAFCNCSGLTSISLPAGVTDIGGSAFYGCSALQSVNYKGTLSQWCGIVFAGQSSNPCYKGAVLYIDGKALPGDLVLPEGTTKINSWAFAGCSSLTSVTVPKSVTTIGESAFHGCSGLTSMTLPFVGGSAEAAEASASTLFGYIFGNQSYTGGKNVIQYYGASSYYETPSKSYCIPTGLKMVTVTGGTLWYGAFYDCTMLTDVTIGDDITAIDERAFYNCSGLTSISLPAGVTDIGGSAFYGCSALQSVNYKGTLSQWCGIVFAGQSSNPCYKGAVLYIDGKALSGDLVLPEGTTKINSWAFAGYNSLTSVTVPKSVTTIGESAFHGCSGLTSMTLPFVGGSASAENASASTLFGYIFGTNSYTGGKNVIQYYGASSYYETPSKNYCIPTGLKTVTVTGGTLWYGAFYDCTMLTDVTISDDITAIGASAFYNCSGLTDIQYIGTTKQWQTIPKGSNWDYSTGAYTVTCTDGTVSKDGTVTPK